MVFAATGHPPFGDDTVVAVINRVMNEPPYLEGVPADLRRLVAACLVKEPQRRPTAQQLMMALIGSGPGGAGQTRMDDPAQATTMLAEGSTLAAGAGAAAAFGAAQAGPHGGQTQRVSPANYTGTLPPVQQPPYRGGGRHTGYDDFEPERRSKWPIFAGIAAIAVLALVVGLFMANRGNNESPNPGSSPTVSDSTSASDSPTSEEPTTERPTYTRPTRPTHTAPTRIPTSEPPTSEPPTSEPPTSEPPTSHTPTTNPTHTSGGGTGGGGTGGGGGGGDGSG
jgi:hypothetical protein